MAEAENEWGTITKRGSRVFTWSREMNASEITQHLKAQAGDSYKRILINHGAREPVQGVKIAELKKLQKQIRSDYPLAL